MRHSLRICITLTCLAWFIGCGRAQAAAVPAASSSPGASATPSATPSPSPIPLPDVVTEANSAAKALRDMNASLASDEVRTKVLEGLSALTGDIDARVAETNRVLSTSPSLEMLGELEKEWQGLHDTAQGWSRDLIRRATELDSQLDQVVAANFHLNRVALDR